MSRLPLQIFNVSAWLPHQEWTFAFLVRSGELHGKNPRPHELRRGLPLIISFRHRILAEISAKKQQRVNIPLEATVLYIWLYRCKEGGISFCRNGKVQTVNGSSTVVGHLPRLQDAVVKVFISKFKFICDMLDDPSFQQSLSIFHRFAAV